MAASSSGVEWGSIVKPILAASYGSFNKNYITDLAKAIIRSEAELLHHDEKYETFYTAFSALAADYISSSISAVCKSQLGSVCAACKILLQYLLASLKKCNVDSSSSILTVKQLLLPIKALCTGQSMLSRSDQVALIALLKNAKLPPHIKTSIPGDSVETKNENKEGKIRSRTDLSNQIMEQLTSPLLDYTLMKQAPPEPTETKSNETTPDKSNEIDHVFIQQNISNLQSLGAADVLIETCLQLPYLNRYINKYNTAVIKKGFSLPSSFSEAQAMRHSLQNVVTDLNVAWSALSLPVLEPLTQTRLEKLTSVTMGCLYCALSTATAASVLGVSSAVSPKTAPPAAANSGGSCKTNEDEVNADALATSVVEKALEIFNLISSVIKTSTRAGGNIHQNYMLIGAWLIISGLQGQLCASSQVPSEKSIKEDKGKSPSKCREGSARINLMKVQQGFGVLSVALASHALRLMGQLLEDVQYECGSFSSVSQAEQFADLHISTQSTALQRALTVLNAVTINQFLFYLATVTYRKACTLKRIQKQPAEGDTFSTSDSTTYYDDDMSCSDESSPDVDDDSEPLLGLWFEETIAIPDNENSSKTQSQDSQESIQKNVADGSSSIVPEKGEPNGYISLATQIFNIMNKYLVTSRAQYLTRYVETGLAEQQMVMLAAIIRDLDRETARTDTGTISVYFGQVLGQLYTEFSQALTQYTHNLLARNLLSSSLQSTLLLHLGVSPFANTDNHSWPLQVYPRTLAVLAQVLLLKPQEEKASACISIWQRLINTLIENICSTPTTTVEAEIDDLNVEHAQLVLFLFHSLNLMQKKSVLLSCANGVMKVSEKVRGVMRESQILHLSRLLLLLDYLVKHLYDAPAALLEQVQWNLLSGTNIMKDGEGGLASRLYCPWNEIDDNYKFIPQDEFSMRPRFYSLTYGELNNQEPPKLCGLACNFILGTPDKVKYPLLMDALVEILSITDQCTPSTRCSEKISYTTLCAIQYCFLICWRLLLQLPPSTPYLEKLAVTNKLDPNPFLLHSLIWGPRTAHKTFIPWMKDCLVKQGMYTQYAESALRNVADVMNSIVHDIIVARNTITALTPQIETRGLLVHKRELPTVMDLCILNAVLAKLQAHFDHSSKTPASTETESHKTNPNMDSKLHSDYILELLPYALNLTEVILACSRSSLMYQITENTEGGNAYTTGDLTAFRSILAIISLKSSKTQTLSSAISPLLPSPVMNVLEKWNENPVKNFPWAEFASDLIPGESYAMLVVKTHISALSAHNVFSINPSLKHLLHCLVSFISEHIVKCSDGHAVWQQAVTVFTPLTLDVCTEYLYDIAIKVLEKAIGDPESDKYQITIYALVLEHIYTLILNYTSATSPCSDVVNEKILHECLAWMESLLEKQAGRQALEKFFDGSLDRSLIHILLSVASPRTSLSSVYGTKVFQFFNKLFTMADKSPSDEELEKLCASILELAHVEASQLSAWLHHVILGPGSGIAPGQNNTNGRETSPPIVTLGIASSTANEPTKTEKTPSTNESTPPPTNGNAKDKKELFQENQLLLQHLTTYIVKQNSGSDAKEAVALTLLEALVPMATQLLLVCQGQGFPQLMYVMAILAGAGSAKGHLSLFLAATHWINICKDELCEKEVLKNIENGDSGGSLVESACAALRYVGDIVHALGPAPQRAPSPPWEGEVVIPPDPGDVDWMEDLTHEEDDESGGDESDEDSLCNKLCTFTITQKEFMNQHWYHCHTCKMIDRVGVCSVCARVCHKGHDVTYAKFGNFFCDCGARESGSCQALTKRNPQSSNAGAEGQQGAGSTTGGNCGIEHMLTSSLRRRPSSPSLDRSQQQKDLAKQVALTKLLENISEPLTAVVSKERSLVSPLVALAKALLPAVEAACQRNSPVGCHRRTKEALKELHSQEKKFVFSDQIMVPTLGSQEGAFENVRMNYSGEQGQTIRQLMSAHMIRRVAMCCLASPQGKRQHLAVAHEKGKITILQLSTLLKQADSSKRKLTLTRLSSAPIPFTVLTVTSNPWNEDFLAVCGLKDCHVLTFTSGGSVADHLVLHPQLEIGNFIIRAIWLPGSQTKLALITADFVKIYDLSIDVLSPQYYFLVPSGKIRDVTFICTEDGKSTLLLMASTGYIYTQDMDEESSAKHGAFYVTNTLELYHPEMKDSNGQICGGGVSVYYSHALRLLFFSYSHGKSFIAPLESGSSQLTDAFLINLSRPSGSGSGSSSGGSSGGNNKGGNSSSGQPQPLCLWTEVANHPGIVCATLQTSNNPVILMIKPDTIFIQEIKVLPAKAKIMDMVVIRHVSSNSELRTTLLILCEDGSLRIYNASPENTGFWLSPSIQAISSLPSHKTTKKKKNPKPAKTSANVSFPVDFFEHCTLLNDVEFGGNDLLQIYNAQQIKHRLNTTGMYVVSTKSVGFNIEIINNDAAHVITGVRVLLGNQDIQRVPAYIEVNGRSIQTTVTRNRWFDFPLTREESTQADKKLILTFGPSQDPDGIIMVDSIKVYGKTKDVFGWPEESEDSQNQPQSSGQQASNASNEPELSPVSSPSMPLLDRMMSGILEVLDGCFALSHLEDKNSLKSTAVSLSTELLTLPTVSGVQKNTKALLAALHPSKQTYHNYKDQAVINYVISSLSTLRKVTDARDLDTEAFYRLVLMTRSIAISRPHNLVKFSQSVETSENGHLVEQLIEILWRLHSARPQNIALASVNIPGLTHVEATVYSLVEIVHAFTVAEHTEAMTALAAKVYLELLLCKDHSVCFSAKHAIIRVLRPRVKRRRVFIPSPPHCSTPGSRATLSNRAPEIDKPGPVSQPSQDSSEAEPNQFEETVEPIVLLAPDPGGVASGVSVNMEALLGGVNGGSGFAPMLDIPPDADDETMVELAIALSLQDHEGGLVNLQAFQNLAGPALQDQAASSAVSKPSTSSSARESKDKIEDNEMEDAQRLALVRQLNNQLPRDLLTRFMRSFLLETNASNMRWQAHGLILSIYSNSDVNEQEAVLEQLWSLWPQLPSYGRKAAQFVDLLGYFSIKSNSNSPDKMEECIEKAVKMLQIQNQVLLQHPNASLYTQLAQYVELEGYYLESDPCLVCNNPELPMTNIKLSSIKIDSKFTTTTQIVKLVSSHTISKITLRIADLKRAKMVRTMNIYYNNRSVQAVVELKNKPAMWHKAKKVNLASGQTEVKVEFPLPIVACNLMIEYADFYENLQASSETLQCPRCSSSVPANPGVCANCGENVFQCHKCRAINYDEKDPFLCHACGFCKYAKFDFTITGRQCCAVDPIENDEDRKKTIAAINSHLEKADRVYKQLVGNKPTLEMLLLRITDHKADRSGADENQAAVSSNNTTNNSSTTAAVSSSASANSTNTMVNRAIQLLAQRYCTDCKTSFEDLSRIIQKVLACRSKLVAYDRSQLEGAMPGGYGYNFPISGEVAPYSVPVQTKCYGCALSATEHCLILLRALSVNSKSRQLLCNHGLVQELVEHNLRRGTTQVQEDVRQLICLVTADNEKATKEICVILMDRIALTLRGHLAVSELSVAVRPEMNLLAALVQKEDSCWEHKLRSVMQLFLISCAEGKSPVIMDSIILPCLKILKGLVKPDQPVSKKYKDKTLDAIASIRPSGSVHLDVLKWLNGEERHSYSSWYKNMPPANSEPASPLKPKSKSEVRARYLEEKYGRRWRDKCSKPMKLTDTAWLRRVMFNPSSRLARQVICNMVECLCSEPNRRREVLDLLTTFLNELGTAGESAAEYLSLYQNLLQESPWKQYLALRGVLLHLANLLTAEIESIHKYEGTVLTSDLSQGYALKMLTELMASFLEQPNIKQQYKGRLVGAVLNGYLSLRRLVVQRTRLIDETQDKLLELLEEMTTGTEEETKAFMTICIQTVEKCSSQDVRTPVFIFERLCSIIYPEENDVGEFFLTLEKDPQQEDFLQGRMLGNPYSCNEPGLGPLMRDVKNKICQDCELIALLEDDNGMELLVNNKIISLDLSVKEVYKKVWVAEGGEGDSMRVVYRMRGLLGDATEEFVETLHAKSQQEVNNEEVYKMANVMADCGGLKVLLSRLSQIKDTVRSRPLLQVILKLLQLCVKVSRNQEVLCHPDLGAISILLNTFQLCVSDSTHQSGQLIDQILEIMETILSKTAMQSPDIFIEMSRKLGSGVEYIRPLLECTSTCPSVRSNPQVLTHLARVVASLTYASRESMTALMAYFNPSLDFVAFDSEHTPEDEQKLELFSILSTAIDRTSLGNKLKDYILSLGIVDKALKYVCSHAPVAKPTLLHSDSDEWKEFISKPSLKYILRFLTGLASHHKPTQDSVSLDCITIIHRLEQVSSDEHVGSLAENLLEALRTNETAASRIEEVRGQTKAEKKRLAMAMREKQLGALGMRTNDKGQLRVESTMMQQMEELGEESGLVCVICREGYKFQPAKVLGVYTFTKRCNVEEFENKSRKTVGYSTVTHFNVVHIDCHMSAVRLARARDEWESAALQNANTKCNGLLPLWGPHVPESAFASCLARHNTYLQESTGHRDISYSSMVHDLKLLLLRFAQEKSFHEDAGGGGPQSNMYIIPYLMHMALYVINTTRCSARETKGLSLYLEERRLENCYEAEGPYYWATLSTLLQSPARWASTRLRHLDRLVLTAHVRHLHPASPPPRLTDLTVKPYHVYKGALLFWALIDAIYNNHFKKVPYTSEDHWPTSLADYIRHNDEALMKSSERLMAIYNDELLPCASFEEFCDVVGLLGEIQIPATYISETLAWFA
ncbi:E3 ubiquitin-protein ligase UBR4 [Halyomorpha halys]|uniref:E3 ubiquitin-protein ligase UBR4 n=1 Tax=Halyomorpha halys TaxID=286706 RepID=UPI0034D227DB